MHDKALGSGTSRVAFPNLPIFKSKAEKQSGHGLVLARTIGWRLVLYSGTAVAAIMIS